MPANPSTKHCASRDWLEQQQQQQQQHPHA
jgi:hypothetical protein